MCYCDFKPNKENAAFQKKNVNKFFVKTIIIYKGWLFIFLVTNDYRDIRKKGKFVTFGLG